MRRECERESNRSAVPGRLQKHLCVYRQKPNSSIGRVVSQLDAPFSLANSIALLLAGGRALFKDYCMFDLKILLVANVFLAAT